MKNTGRFAGVALALTLLGFGPARGDSRHHPSAPFQFPARRPPHNPAPTLPPPPSGQFGDPLPGLTRDELAAFAAGREEFENVETPAGGLGPIFNNTSCAACHTAPVVGGASALFVTRFGRTVNGVFDPLTERGGSLLQQFAIAPELQEVIPPEANTVALRITTPLFGLGLIEAIPDEVLRRYAARPKPDGVRGRVATLVDVTTGETRVGHFGWKAQQATLLAFAGDAYVNEMGITSRFFPTENAPDGNVALLTRFDAVADPEDAVDPSSEEGDIDAAADFIRFLAPPPPLPLTQSARAGWTVFHRAGCAVCHEPVLPTGRHAVAALDRQAVPLFSDLLLHDMGALGDGIAQGTAGPREMKTASLWGLRVRPVYLHDGRATTVDAAIRAHDGEAARSRENYRGLTPGSRRQLLEFLNSI